MVKNLFTQKIDAFIVNSPVNRFYFTKFNASWGSVLLHKDRKIFYTDARYGESAIAKVKDFEVKIVKAKDYLEAISADLKTLAVKTLGYEDNFVSVGAFKNLKKELVDFTFKEASEFIDKERLIKSDYEITKIRACQAVAEKVFDKVVATIIKPGITEKEVKTALIIESLKLGADDMAFEPIVCFSENASIPHHKASDRKFVKNDVVLIDFGVRIDGYNSDMTRTFCLGEPSEKMQYIYNTVLDAQEYVLKYLKAGITCKEADALAREFIKANDYEKEFSHSLGHGIGLNVHESPFLSEHKEDMLLPGMVVTVEPGIYIEGVGGVRIEDMIVIKEDGIENLTATKKEFIL
ncbi:MAG: Xaa-Pro peptidase family protein [Firmicutes bacterium]|nr:Xaa-Pro peptidase family protein [Bacillota bacterium]